MKSLLAVLPTAALLAACASPAVPTVARTVSLAEANCPKPAYPAEARRTGAEGVTTLSFDVDAAGKVTRVAILEHSGSTDAHRALDALALETVQKCAFPPAPGFLAGTSRVAYTWRISE